MCADEMRSDAGRATPDADGSCGYRSARWSAAGARSGPTTLTSFTAAVRAMACYVRCARERPADHRSDGRLVGTTVAEVGCYPFDDHNAPPFTMIRDFCEDVHKWLSADEKNVVAIHCKAGKGRTGCMICMYMLYTRQWTEPAEALKYYGLARTQNGKVAAAHAERAARPAAAHADIVRMSFRGPGRLARVSPSLARSATCTTTARCSTRPSCTSRRRCS